MFKQNIRKNNDLAVVAKNKVAIAPTSLNVFSIEIFFLKYDENLQKTQNAK